MKQKPPQKARHDKPPALDQLGFDNILVDADTANEEAKRRRQREDIDAAAAIEAAKERKRLAHLPATMDEGLPYFEKLLDRFNTAMIADDEAAVEAIMEQADDLAYKLNNFNPGFLGGGDASGNVLTRLTAMKVGQVPSWGREGAFEVEYRGIPVRITQDGLFGVGGPGFAIHA